ncbi:MAG: hypothetical protein ACK5WY_05435 [Holosporaceae bacterium]|jgi:hypothetical protein
MTINQDAENLYRPVLLNCYWVKCGIGLYEGIAKHAKEINKKHGHFFGVTMQFSMHEAINCLCKIYDKSNKGYKKHTVYELLNFLKNTDILSTKDNFYIKTRYKREKLEELGLSEINNFLNEDIKFEKTKKEFFDYFEKNIPNKDSNDTLSKLLKYRNKILAHTEILKTENIHELTYLPPIEEMEKLNNWAIKFIDLFCNFFDFSSPSINVCSRMAALNVVKKVLEKNLSTLEEQDDFYKR